MNAGYVTIAESDSYLGLQLGSDPWFDSETIPPLSGSAISSLPADPSDLLVGIGTAFTTDFTVGDILEIDYQIATIAAITDDSNLQLSEKVLVLSASAIYKLTVDQAARRKALYRKKLQSLITAQRRMLQLIDISAETAVPQAVKDAQCAFALNLFIRPSNKHAENQANGIKSYQIGDMKYDYGGIMEPLLPEIKAMLDPWLLSNVPVKLYRQPMNPGPFLDGMGNEFSIPTIP